MVAVANYLASAREVTVGVLPNSSALLWEIGAKAHNNLKATQVLVDLKPETSERFFFFFFSLALRRKGRSYMCLPPILGGREVGCMFCQANGS